MTFTTTRRIFFASAKLPAKYFVLSMAMLSFATSSWGSPIMIDDFLTPQSVTGTANTPNAFSSVAAPEAIGGERDMEVHLMGGFTSLSLSSNPFGGELLVHDSGATVTGMSTTVWDGVDGSSAINYSGLGGVDLLTGQDAVQLDFVVADLTGSISLTIYDASDATGATSSAATFSLPGGIFTPTQVLLPFTDFTTLGANGAANFANVGAIKLDISNDTTGSLDVIIGRISVVPEPGSITLALVAGLMMVLFGFHKN
jgi:hypothetical protein